MLVNVSLMLRVASHLFSLLRESVAESVEMHGMIAAIRNERAPHEASLRALMTFITGE